MSYKILKPYVRVFELLGSTGSGKTTVATVPAVKEAREILMKGIGSTNSTLSERILVYTDEYADKMVIAVKHEKHAFTRNQYTKLLSTSIAQVVQSCGKSTDFTADKAKTVLENKLVSQLSRKDNFKAILSLLNNEHESYKKQVDIFIQKICALYLDFELYKLNSIIYYTVKNNMLDVEVKENSQKFLSALRQEVERTLDIQKNDFKEKLWDIWEFINQNLSSVFFHYFNKDDISDDGYYYKEIMLDSPDTNFIGAMFTANDLPAGQKLSLEVLCNKIVIYIPMRKEISELIASKPETKEVFQDSMGHIVFGILDTRGLYHADNTEDENTDYCSELLYKGDIDAIAIAVPLEGDTNGRKAGELYRNLLKTFNKDIPLFMIHTKLDLYVSALFKQDFNDPLSLEPCKQKEISKEDFEPIIRHHMGTLSEDLIEAQNTSKRRFSIQFLPCWLKRDSSFPTNLIPDYSIYKVYKNIFENIADSLKDNAHKIKFQVKEGEIPTPHIDRDCLRKLIHDHMFDPTTVKKVFWPGISDIMLNIGKAPHGNAYNALRRRLKNGDGYTSNIDEGYFYNCQSFSVNFTGNLRNFSSSTFIHSVVSGTLDIAGADRLPEDNEAFLKTVEKYINPKDLVSFLLYENAFLKAEQTAFSFKNKFQNFLQGSMLYFNLAQIDENAYAEALEQIIIEAANKALALNVTFR